MALSFTRNLKFQLPMMNGPDVKALQARLFDLGFGRKKDIDSLFGPGTRNTVKAFQSSRGVTVDGIAGQVTFDRLGQSQPAAGAAAPAFGAAPPSLAPQADRLLPAHWMPDAAMKRIILHWTAGSYTPSNLDKKHYHIVIDGQGHPHRGFHGIDANVPPLRSASYAAHTKGTNSRSIGVSACSMLNAHEIPFDAGDFPLNETQWEALAQVSAELCLRYDIPVSRQTVLGHGEVQDILNRPQSGKWDPMALPWMPGLPFRQVGDMLRSRTQQILDQLKNPSLATTLLDTDEAPPLEQVAVDDAILPGTSFDGRNWIDLSKLAEHLGWPAPLVQDGAASFSTPPIAIAVEQMTDADGFPRLWAQVTEISQKLGMEIIEDPHGNQNLKTVVQSDAPDAPRKVTVQPGQTLRKIARHWLGDAKRWPELTDASGQGFDAISARTLRVGQIVLVAADAAAHPTPKPPAGAQLSNAKVNAIAKTIVANYPHVVGATTRAKMTDSVVAILKACNSHAVSDPSHQAYILATANHESNLGQFMREIWGDPPTKAQKRYAHILGNSSKEDGFKYRGRGFVQITGKSNYKRYGDLFGHDFVADPALVERKEIAAEILVRGMTELGFTKKGFVLNDLGEDGAFDFVGARALINGDKNFKGGVRYPGKTKGQGIAAIGLQYRAIIVAA